MLIINEKFIKKNELNRLNIVHLGIFSYIAKTIEYAQKEDTKRKIKEKEWIKLYKVKQDEIIEQMSHILPFKTKSALSNRLNNLEDMSFIIRDWSYLWIWKFGLDYLKKTDEFDLDTKVIYEEKDDVDTLKYKEDSFEYLIAEWFLELNKKKMKIWIKKVWKQRAVQDWAHTVLLLKKDICEYLFIMNDDWDEKKFKYEECEYKKESETIIRKVLDFARTDTFWSWQIFSIKKLRKKNKNNIKYWRVLYDKIDNKKREKFNLTPKEQEMLRKNYKRFLRAYPRPKKGVNHQRLKGLFVEYLIREKVDFESILQWVKDYSLQCKIRGTQTAYTYKHETFLGNREWERDFQTNFNNKDDLIAEYRKLGSKKFQERFWKEKLDKAKKLI